MVLGIDLSLTGTGCVTIYDNGEHTEQLIRSKPPKVKSPTTEIKRIMKIRDDIKIDSVSLVAIEGISFMSRNSTSLAQLSGLNYMVREKLINIGLPFVIVAPTSLKKFVTGKGNCGKDVMMMETYKRWGASLPNDNLCDGFGLAKIAEALADESIELIKPQQEVINLVKTQL